MNKTVAVISVEQKPEISSIDGHIAEIIPVLFETVN